VGSHKTNFARRRDLFSWYGYPHSPPPPGVVHITPQAGDYVILPEATVHGVLSWRATHRQRRVLVLRFQPQNSSGEFHGTSNLTPKLYDRLSSFTHELMAPAAFDTIKKIVAAPPVSADNLGPGAHMDTSKPMATASKL
jgi:hypothetical protein